MGHHQIDVGPVRLEWDDEARRAVLRFVERGRGGRDGAAELTSALDAWVKQTDEPFDFLVDCSEMVDVDASWRAIWADYFRDNRDRARIAWFGASPRIQLVVVMFIKSTGIEGQVFATEPEARAWLDEQRSR